MISVKKSEISFESISGMPLSKEDISFTHSVFAQCFLPLRTLKNGQTIYTVKHGRASLAIQAGVLLNPVTGDLEQQNVPYGSAARIVLAHIHNHIIRSGSLEESIEIPMGESLRNFFRKYNLSYGGKNGKQIETQVRNIAAAHITIGLWNENHAVQVDVPKLAKRIDFWLERDERQRSLWQPCMTINPEYAETIKERAVPLDIRVLIGLYGKPRAIDVFTWLSYRLPLIHEKKGVFLPYFGKHGLHTIFGSTIQHKGMFKAGFEKTLKEVAKYYSEARLSLEKDGLRLFNSPSPIPPDYSVVEGKSLFFVNGS